jgi:hypothetical protein
MQNELSPGTLGCELRGGSSPFLRRRRSIVGLAFLSSTVLGGIALYQMGVLKKLPGPRWSGFDAEKVSRFSQAYSILALPDALLGLTSYGVTACPAGMGPENRWRTYPLIPLGMGVKLLSDAALAGKRTVDACRKYRSISVWSLLAAAATSAPLPLAIPEAQAAFRCLTGEDHGQ